MIGLTISRTHRLSGRTIPLFLAFAWLALAPGSLPAQRSRPASGDQWSPRALAQAYAHINVAEIQSGGPPKDGIPALNDPDAVDAGKAGYLAPGDRIIGVTVGDEARAYPLRILNWHEIVNDTLNERPIAVTYCPLCDSAVVFDREISGQVREFGVSGKLYRSNVLMYDRQADPADESLWSQLQLRAVVGPAAGDNLRLELLPAVVTSWAEWRRDHPHTTVLSLKTGHTRDYSSNPYRSYFNNDRVGFGSHGGSDRRPDLKNKDRVVIAFVGKASRIYAVKDVANAAGRGGSVRDELNGVPLVIRHLPDGESLEVRPAEDDSPEDVGIVHTFWFAWEDISPGADLWAPGS